MYQTSTNLLSESDVSEKDEELLIRSLSQPSAFALLLERYQDAFLRKAQSIIHSREEAEDIVQETFLKIYAHAGQFKVQEGASFKSWAYKILCNTAFTHYERLKRQRAVRADIEPEFYESLPDTALRQFEKGEVSDYLISIFSRMPRQLKRVLELHFIDGLQQSEIAAVEGITVGAVKTRVHRAKKAFKSIQQTLE